MTAKAKLLPVLLLIALPGLAQDAPEKPALPKEVQKFLSVPTWYLSYKVSVVCHDGGSGNDDSSWSIDMERNTSGTAQLGIRTQGPSLSMITGGVPMQGQAFFDAIDHFANWIGGVKTDKNKPQEQQDAEQLRALQANQKAFEQFSLTQESQQPGAGVEGPGPVGMEKQKLTEGGSAPVSCMADFHLEIDGAKKKFKFKFASGFNDTEQSAKAVTGESVDKIGQPAENHRPIETAMYPGTPQVVSGGPTNAIEGDLPASFGNLSGSPSYPVRLITPKGPRGTMTIQFVLSPKPPEPAELLIIPPDDYEAWRPMAGKNELFSGDWVPIKVKLQKKGGGTPQFKAQRFVYRLKETSKERGICMNWPPQPEANTPFDLQFEKDTNGQDIEVIGTDGQTAQQTTSAEYMTEGEIIVSSFDYGAWGELEAEAELENGEIVRGVVKGTNEQRLRLPARKKDSKIANVFLKGLGNLKDDDDSEDDPVGDHFKGDGLVLYEEYRGFMEGDHWTAGDPKKKDVFVLNQMRELPQSLRGIEVFENATGLKVHSKLKDNQVNGPMMINFYCTACPHKVDQHVIRIQAGSTKKGTAAFVEDVGTPGTAKSVHMPPNWEEFRQVGTRRVPSFERTLAHEMSHDCNIYHHGEADKTVWWRITNSVPEQIIEVEVYYDENQGQYFAVSPAVAVITVKKEDGSVVPPRSVIPAGTNQRIVKLGVPHGQHSGNADCLMRYWIAFAYRSLTEPNVRYLSGGEIRGTIHCTSANGTGINDAGRLPQSRYGTAATAANGGPDVKANRGDCKHQLRVNDKGDEPQR